MRIVTISHRLFLLTIGVILLLGLSDAAMAQSDESSSRLESLRQRSQETMRTILDKAQKKQQRLDALRKAVIHKREAFEALVHIAEDPEEDEEVRRETFRTLPFGNDLLKAQLRLLREAKEGKTALVAGIIGDLGGRARLHHDSQALRETMETVGALLTDQRQDVRQAAFRLLVPMHDQRSMTLVLDGLRDSKKALVPPVVAIELLHSAGALAHADAIRPFLDDPDSAVRAKAALAAAVDTKSRPKIIQLLKDRRQPTEVRVAALSGLSASDAGYPQYSLDLIKDQTESPDVRQAAIHRLVGFMNYRPIEEATRKEFVQVIDQLATSGDGQGDALSELASKTRTYLQKRPVAR